MQFANPHALRTHTALARLDQVVQAVVHCVKPGPGPHAVGHHMDLPEACLTETSEQFSNSLQEQRRGRALGFGLVFPIRRRS